MPEFPSKTIVKSFSGATIRSRTDQLNLFLNAVCTSMALTQMDEVLYFLDAKSRLPKVGLVPKTVIMPLPDKDFDPTECTCPADGSFRRYPALLCSHRRTHPHLCTLV